jgi:hypothetical protein
VPPDVEDDVAGVVLAAAGAAVVGSGATYGASDVVGAT